MKKSKITIELLRELTKLEVTEIGSFNSPLEFIEATEKLEQKDGDPLHIKLYCEKFKELVTDGDHDTLEAFLKYRQSLPVQSKNVELNYQYDYAGDHVDVGRFLMGDPENMIEYSHNSQVRFCDVRIRLSRPKVVSMVHIFAYYSMILDILDQLESQNIRCRILARVDLITPHKKGKRFGVDILFKDYQEPLNLGVFAAVFLNQYFYVMIAFQGFLPSYTKLSGSNFFGVDGYTEIANEQNTWDNKLLFPSVRHYESRRFDIRLFKTETFLPEIGLPELLQN
ncbi:DUF7192 family protein [Tellurirhabdus bombi]|uniref:DUF7192 family protein n=1 Tax=Tellurirhabdus bombi TaxID=2907205 RepID=UPI001F257758|nr:hypothetical protein [Tellurirhabdus bombi]